MDLSVISIAVSISVSLAAIISPGIVTWMNNRHQLKIKKMELLQEQFEKNTLHEREIWENYLIENDSTSATKQLEEMIPKIKQLIRLQL